ncbi:MAG TPA: phosphatase PAP2 family protein [Mycobacteriales bacterium]|nr:phosphatase PAP2 family protein [Mycobacteriales bacterium]
MLHAIERFSLGPTPAWIIAAGLAIVGIGLAWRTRGRWRTTGLVLREAGVVMALYGLWMFLGAHTGGSADGAYARARSIMHAEQAVHLHPEVWLQHGVLGHPWLVKTANIFYATMHFPGMIALLVWAFLRHRGRYAGVRLRVVLVTATCLLIQLVPVAPPRLLAGSGLVDTPLRYGQSVYDAAFAQLSAMPSVHIAWATVVAGEVLRCGRSRWRVWVVLHPLVTLWVVMVTGNHWLFDGLAGAGIAAGYEVLLWALARFRAVRVPGPVAAVSAVSTAAAVPVADGSPAGR